MNTDFIKIFGVSRVNGSFLFDLKKFPSLEEAFKIATETHGSETFAQFCARAERVNSSYKTCSLSEMSLTHNDFKEFVETATPKDLLVESSLNLPGLVMDILTSAKIAKEVIKNFDPREVLEVQEFFESNEELLEAIEISHEKLRPVYEEYVQTWFDETSGTTNELASEKIILESVSQCMKQGRSAILKSPEFKLFESFDSAKKEIKKSRSWSDIVKDNE